MPRSLSPRRRAAALCLFIAALVVAAGVLWTAQRPRPLTVDAPEPHEFVHAYHFAREIPRIRVPMFLAATKESREVLAPRRAAINEAGFLSPIVSAPSPYTSAPVRVPAGAELRFDVLAVRPFESRPVERIQFRVEVESDDGTRHLLYDEFATPRRFGDPMEWRPGVVSLDAFAGQTLRFIFSNAPLRRLGGDAGVKAFWGNPVLSVRPAQSSPERPNVVLISLDTLRADVLQCYGYPGESSPYLNVFAQTAHVFEQCMSPSSWTLPAHASLFTGLHPSQHGAISFEGGSLPATMSTLSEIAAANDYRTAAFTNGGYVDSVFGFARGFERYSKYPPIHTGNSIGDALNWIDALDGAPFFVFLHNYLMHEPYLPRPEDLAKFADPDYTGPVARSFEFDNREFVEGLNEADRRQVKHLYIAQLPQLDAMLELFFARLKQEGLWDNTLIAIFSDHGEEFWEHGSVDHGVTLYEEQIHVPLIVKLPEQQTGSRISELVDLTDLFATIAPWLGSADHGSRQSRDLNPLMGWGARQPARAFVVSEVGFRESPWGEIPFKPVRIAVRTPSFKLVDNSEGLPMEFYDLLADPGEGQNTAPQAAPSMQELVELLEHYKSTQGADQSLWSKGLDEQSLKDLQPQLEALGYL